jgi:hypothetical protein
MPIKLKPQQFEPLSEFCLGIAKGLMLAVFIGQGLVSEISGLRQLVLSLSWVIMSCLFLLLAVVFKKEVKQ